MWLVVNPNRVNPGIRAVWAGALEAAAMPKYVSTPACIVLSQRLVTASWRSMQQLGEISALPELQTGPHGMNPCYPIAFIFIPYYRSILARSFSRRNWKAS